MPNNSRLYREKQRKKTRYSSDSDSEREKSRKYREKAYKSKDRRSRERSSGTSRHKTRKRYSSSSSSSASSRSSSSSSSSSSGREKTSSKRDKRSSRSSSKCKFAQLPLDPIEPPSSLTSSWPHHQVRDQRLVQRGGQGEDHRLHRRRILQAGNVPVEGRKENCAAQGQNSGADDARSCRPGGRVADTSELPRRWGGKGR